MRPMIQRATLAAMKRSKATMAAPQGMHNLSPQSAVPPQLLHPTSTSKVGGFQANWLSDPSTYPIIVIMSFALTFMTGMGLHALAYYKDVRINPSKKHAELQTWGSERVTPVVQVLGANNPYYKPTFTEGLGVDHEEWVKAKQAQQQ